MCCIVQRGVTSIPWDAGRARIAALTFRCVQSETSPHWLASLSYLVVLHQPTLEFVFISADGLRDSIGSGAGKCDQKVFHHRFFQIYIGFTVYEGATFLCMSNDLERNRCSKLTQNGWFYCFEVWILQKNFNVVFFFYVALILVQPAHE